MAEPTVLARTPESTPVAITPVAITPVASTSTPRLSAVDVVDAPVVVESELLVEDVSIDGMCGVY